MSNSSRSSQMLDVPGSSGCADVGGGSGAGGFWGPPPSAIAATESTHENTKAVSSLFKAGLSPFAGADEHDSIVPTGLDAKSLFTLFWDLRCAGKVIEALTVCDRLLETLDPSDFPSHLRQSNARAMALRDLLRFHDSKTVHLQARPFASVVTDFTLRGDHFHGTGCTLTELGDYLWAYKALAEARSLYLSAEESSRALHTDINIARLYAKAGRPALALSLLDTLPISPDADIARALAHERAGDKREARRAIASALVLLADSENEATRKEALIVMKRIEGEG